MSLRRNDAPRLPQHLTRLGIPHVGTFTNFSATQKLCDCGFAISFFHCSVRHIDFSFGLSFGKDLMRFVLVCVVVTGDVVICISYRNSATRVPTVCAKQITH